MTEREVAKALAQLFRRKEAVLSGTFRLSSDGVRFTAAPGTRARWFDEWFGDLQPVLKRAFLAGITEVSVKYDGSNVHISVGTQTFRYKF